MTTKDYIHGSSNLEENPQVVGRVKYGRPQAMLWADNPGTVVDGFYVPTGFEVGANLSDVAELTSSDVDQFLILSDDNRESIQFKNTRIEQRKRMVNGRMRSYYVADKLTISSSWKMLPSRSYSRPPLFDPETGRPTNSAFTINDSNPENIDTNNALGGIRVPSAASTSITGYELIEKLQYTSDGGAGGVEMLEWYRNHSGSFWVYLAYDNYRNFGNNDSAYQNLGKYNEVIEVFFADFTYDVVKRGATNHDYWDISVTLEEV
jgi:hypothetical protein